MITTIAHMDQHAEGKAYPGYVWVQMEFLLQWLKIQRKNGHDPMIKKAVIE
jgi:hypothetical protein